MAKAFSHRGAETAAEGGGGVSSATSEKARVVPSQLKWSALTTVVCATVPAPTGTVQTLADSVANARTILQAARDGCGRS